MRWRLEIIEQDRWTTVRTWKKMIWRCQKNGSQKYLISKIYINFIFSYIIVKKLIKLCGNVTVCKTTVFFINSERFVWIYYYLDIYILIIIFSRILQNY